ncbi:MAG: helix-turn-helix transcriptional regulator [Chitinophagaceae bacterium]|jgi:transcriptional regulator with XRE-family HTH domain|nr:helix-turn-helix transcriptional regulator [Chitinophagaceae bacterium]
MSNTKLKAIRERHNLSQIQMGEILHLSQSAYQKLENGKSSLRCEQIVVLIKQFGEGARDLLEDDGIEIIFKNNAISNDTMNDNVQIKNLNNVSKELLYEILEKINDIKIRLNP